MRMSPNFSRRTYFTNAFVVSLALVCWVGSATPSSAQDDARGGLGLSRFFRFGSSKNDSKSDQEHNHDHPRNDQIARTPTDRNFKPNSELPSDAATTFSPAVTSPGFGDSSSTRVTARPRHNGPVTEADPILTRVGLGRSPWRCLSSSVRRTGAFSSSTHYSRSGPVCGYQMGAYLGYPTL